MEAWADRCEPLAKELESLAEEPLALALRQAAAALDHGPFPFRIVVFGEFNRGKSTLLNALLGRVVLPAKLVPTTGHVTTVSWGDDERVAVRFADGRSETCPLPRLEEFAVLKEGAAREDVAAIDVFVRSPLLQAGLRFVDTPGVSDAAAQTRRAEDALREADLVLFVLDATRLLGESERDLVERFMIGRFAKPVVPVLNRLNLVDPDERGEILAILDRWQRESAPQKLSRGWYAVNAVGALRRAVGAAGSASSADAADDFETLRRDLAELTAPVAAGLAWAPRRRRLHNALKQAEAANSAALETLRADRGKIDARRGAASSALRDAQAACEVELLRGYQAVSTAAPLAFDKAWDEFSARLEDPAPDLGGAADLREAAASWYRHAESRAVEQLETAAGRAFADALRGLGAPVRYDPFTLRERLSLEARFEAAGPLGAVVRDWLGNDVVDWLEGWWSAPPAERIRDEARRRWEAFAPHVRDLLDEQWAARRSEVGRQVQRERRRLERLAEPARGQWERQTREQAAAEIERILLLLGPA